MKLLYWTPFFLPDTGGIELVAARVLPEFQRRGYEIKVVASHGREPTEPLSDFGGIAVHRFDFHEMFRRNDLKTILATQAQVDRLKQEFNPDVIHFNLSDPSVFFHTRSRAARKPVVMALRRDLADEAHQGAQGELFWNALRDADWVTSVCTSTKEIVLDKLPEVATRLSVQYNPIDIDRFSDSLPPFAPPRLLCLARLAVVKGVDRAIAAMKTIFARFPDATLTLAGDGVERANLERQVAESGLGDAVNFLGAVAPDAVPGLLRESTLVLLPSRSEGFPNVALEAGASARALVTFPVGEVEAIVRHGETGLVVPQGDVEALAEAVCSLLAEPGRATAMGHAARKRVESRFGMESYLDDHHRLYTRLAEGGSH